VDKRLIGEFLGTAILILLGNGTVAGVLLHKSKSEAAGWIAITTGWAMAVMAGVFTAIAFGSPDAHINPAVTLGVAVSTGDFSKFVPYAIAQLLGGIAGATLVWLHWLPHWAQTPDPGAKLACFSTGPAIRKPVANLLSEIIATFVLVLVGNAIGAKGPLAPGVGPYVVGALVWGIGIGLGGTTGYAINPARDLGPRIAHAILPIAGKGSSDWGYAGIPIAGPLIGAVLAGLMIRLAS
jgi:glycerol uptake facilitator protein